MIIVATTSLPAVDRPNADRWNATRSRQNLLGPNPSRMKVVYTRDTQCMTTCEYDVRRPFIGRRPLIKDTLLENNRLNLIGQKATCGLGVVIFMNFYSLKRIPILFQAGAYLCLVLGCVYTDLYSSLLD